METTVIVVGLWLAIGAIGCDAVIRWLATGTPYESEFEHLPLGYLLFVAFGPIGVVVLAFLIVMVMLAPDDSPYTG